MSRPRISRRVREEAIDGCLAVADARGRRIDCAMMELFHDAVTADLAFAALRAVPDDAHDSESVFDEFHGCWLEAAALLRDGWSPGDPVRRLR